jgi:hypothetical protein
MPTNAMIVKNRSASLPALMALYSPKQIATNIQRSAAPTASEIVRGSPFRISSPTGSCVNCDFRSPVKTFFIVVRYCCHRGSLNPHSLRIASIVDSLTWRPAIRTAGSLFGITLKIRNVITDTANITITI